MGAKQTKGQEPAGASPQHGWKRTPTKERGDILASLMLKSGDRLSRGGTPPPPYQRRISMIQEMMLMAKQGKQDEATEMLKTLRQVRVAPSPSPSPPLLVRAFDPTQVDASETSGAHVSKRGRPDLSCSACCAAAARCRLLGCEVCFCGHL